MGASRSIRIDMDAPAYDLLLRLREAIVAKNVKRTMSLEFDNYERATIKAIIQRGVRSLAAEYDLVSDNQDVI